MIQKGEKENKKLLRASVSSLGCLAWTLVSISSFACHHRFGSLASFSRRTDSVLIAGESTKV